MGYRERVSANRKAERFYNGLLLLAAIRSHAFALQNWKSLPVACRDVENMLPKANLGCTEQQVKTALARLTQIRAMVNTTPRTPEDWSALDESVREFSEALGVEVHALDLP